MPQNSLISSIGPIENTFSLGSSSISGVYYSSPRYIGKYITHGYNFYVDNSSSLGSCLIIIEVSNDPNQENWHHLFIEQVAPSSTSFNYEYIRVQISGKGVATVSESHTPWYYKLSREQIPFTPLPPPTEIVPTYTETETITETETTTITATETQTSTATETETLTESETETLTATETETLTATETETLTATETETLTETDTETLTTTETETLTETETETLTTTETETLTTTETETLTATETETLTETETETETLTKTDTETLTTTETETLTETETETLTETETETLTETETETKTETETITETETETETLTETETETLTETETETLTETETETLTETETETETETITKTETKTETETETETHTITETETLSLPPNCCDGFGDTTSNTTGDQYSSSDGFNVSGFDSGGSLCHYSLNISGTNSKVTYTVSDTFSGAPPIIIANLTLSYPIIDGRIRYIQPNGQCWLGNLEDADGSNQVTMVKIEDYVEPKTFYDLTTAIATHNSNVSTFSGMAFMVTCPGCKGKKPDDLPFTGADCLNQVSEGDVLSRCPHSFLFNGSAPFDAIGDGLKNLDSSDSITTNDEAWNILEGATIFSKNGSLGVEV
jgi:hypothetical protein